ncbi:MAG: DUF3052 family protein [Acidimicrobiia bacterium]|nr:MAG: DUF3052 family protein [Acidimicrobiia bacterium]
MIAGYSGTPLSRKLGITTGVRVGTFGAPPSFADLLDPLPTGAKLVRSPRAPCPVLVVFATTSAELESRFTRAVGLLASDAGLWVAWPKKTSRVETEIDFDAVQTLGLAAGLVDNKVAAIDATWSGLRFVVRTKDRQGWSGPS